MAESLRGRIALVTGAGHRLGRQIALALASQGADVIVHFRGSGDEAAELCRQIESGGARGWQLGADLDDPAAVEAVVPRARKLAGDLSILVNNASIFPPGSLAAMRIEELMDILRVNAWAPFVLGRAVAQSSEEARIVNILDTRVAGWASDHAAYTVSKHLLAVLTRMMALEFAPRATVNAVAPGPILPPPGGTEETLERLASQVPLKRRGSAEDIAEAVTFLARSAYITGQVLFVDGGKHLLGSGAWTAS